MITILTGENSFEVHEALRQLTAGFSGVPERLDGSTLTVANLPDLFMGVSLFAQERLVIIDQLSASSAVWEKLPDWLARITDDIHVVLIEPKLDKRTTTYKALKEAASIQEFPAWGERDGVKAETWTAHRAQAQKVVIDKALIKHLVERVGLDQWQLANALGQLSLLDTITKEVINDVIPANPTENVFQLFESALQGDSAQVARMVDTLEFQEDPYMLFALLSSQVMTLAAVTFATDEVNPTKDFAIHPFVAGKLTRSGNKLGKAKVATILQKCAAVDAGLKRSKGEPWLLVETFLLEVAALARQ